MLTDKQDAFGHLLHDYFTGEENYEIVERDDGYILAGNVGTSRYFKEFLQWGEHEKLAIEHAAGRILDIGCGAGKHSLYLQQQGYEVVGTDISPLAIRVCQKRGLKKTSLIPITRINSKLGTFDTILMMGHNFGLVSNIKRAQWLLKRFAIMTSPDAKIIAETFCPYQTENTDHLEYHRINRNRNRMGGQLRLRIRYKGYSTPWFDYLQVSKSEIQDIIKSTGWTIEHYIESGKPTYIAILKKKSIS